MWIRHSAGNEHFEILIVLNLNVAHFDEILKSPLKHILLKHRIQHRIQPFLDILNQKGISLSDAILELVHETLVVQLRDEQIIGLLPLLDPDVRLRLRVDYQRPPDAVVYYHTVLLREVV